MPPRTYPPTHGLAAAAGGEFPFQGLLLLPSHTPNPITKGRRLTATTTVKRHFPPPKKKNTASLHEMPSKKASSTRKKALFFALPSYPRSVIFRHFLLLYLYTRWNEYKERRQLCKVASAPTFTQGREYKKPSKLRRISILRNIFCGEYHRVQNGRKTVAECYSYRQMWRYTLCFLENRESPLISFFSFGGKGCVRGAKYPPSSYHSLSPPFPYTSFYLGSFLLFFLFFIPEPKHFFFFLSEIREKLSGEKRKWKKSLL